MDPLVELIPFTKRENWIGSHIPAYGSSEEIVQVGAGAC
jgi:hypothetical protein